MCERPRLPSGSINGDGEIAKSLLHKSRDDHPVPPVWRGPTVLENLTIQTGRFRLLW